jgi:kynureninase
MDDASALARERFSIPRDVIYLDGNSLGALPKATPERLRALMREEWRTDLIASWNKHQWIDLPATVAARLAPIVGARPSELLIADSTSVSLFKLLGAAVRARPGRRAVLTLDNNFPTDLYVIQGLCTMLGLELRAVEPDALAGAIDEDVAVVTLTHVNYRSAAIHDMGAGAIVLDLDGTGCDLAVGCGYKYLNGGPGAPAFIFVREDLQAELSPPLQGWMGHHEPFAFDPHFRPAEGIARFLTGTPSILALAALDCGLATFEGIAMPAVEARSRQLSQSFIEAIEERSGDHVTLASPREPASRGSHVCFAHPNGYAVMQALIERKVIGDFRAPDLLRFGFAPLYNSVEDVTRAAAILGEILDTRAWDEPRHHARRRVT